MTRAHPRRGAGSAKQAFHDGVMPRIGTAAHSIRMRGANDNRMPLRHRIRQMLALVVIAGLIAGVATMMVG